MKLIKILVLFLLLVGWVADAQEVPYFEYTWNEGDGPISLSREDLDHFGQTIGRFEIDWTPSILHTTGINQILLDIPGHLGVWVWNDGIHGQWYNEIDERRLFRTRWGLPAIGTEIKIVVTWDPAGYAVIVDGILRIHDWQTPPTTVFPDPDIVSGVYGARANGGLPASGTFKLRAYNLAVPYDPCSVDTVGTINKSVPRDHSESWAEGIDPSCSAPTPPTPTQNIIIFTAEATTGIGTVTPVLTWDTMPFADDCIASGDWSGRKGGAGTETLSSITTGATYNITCEWGDAIVILNWTAPTENTDGTPYTDAKGYKIYFGSSQAGPYNNIIDIQNPAILTYVLDSLISGAWFFVVTAYNLNDIESDISNEAMRILGLTSETKSVGITVNPTPNAPSNLNAQ